MAVRLIALRLTDIIAAIGLVRDALDGVSLKALEASRRKR